MIDLPIKTVEDVDGNVYHLTEIIGQGGQGVVFKTTDDNLAVKITLDENNDIVRDEEFYKQFENKINDIVIMDIDDDIKLAKPEIMLKKPVSGYVMKLLSTLKPIKNLIFDPNTDENLYLFLNETNSLKKRLEVLLELARTLARLHSKGIVYGDISPNNIFYSDAENFSNVWLIDCDNIKFNHEHQKAVYTEGYGAPEVINNFTGNTIYSDTFSFAILAFRVLTNRNPFEDESVKSDDGWDVSTTDNIEVKDINVPWLLENEMTDDLFDYFKHFMDDQLLEMFKETFSKASRIDPTSRPSTRSWYEAFKVALTRIYQCECGIYNFSFEEQCPFCKAEKIVKQFVYINHINKEKNDEIINESKNKIIFDEDYLDDFTDFNSGLELKSEEMKKLNYISKYDSPLIIFDKLNIYNFNIFDISIDLLPFEVVSFAYYENQLFLINRTNNDVVLKINEEEKTISGGDSYPLSLTNTVYLILINDPITNVKKELRIFNYE